MFIQDLSNIFYWWSILFLLGSLFFPLTAKLFGKFVDHGYIFSKVIGMVVLSYLVWITGITHILPFFRSSLLLICVLIFLLNAVILFFRKKSTDTSDIKNWKLIFFEELLFFLTLSFWAFVKAHQPDIIGLEKYMDFGFINSLLRSTYFPPLDMWLASSPTYSGHFINYYYFGHLVTAVLTRLSDLHPAVTFNLMLSTIFAFTFTGSFSIAINLISSLSLRGGARSATTWQSIQNMSNSNNLKDSSPHSVGLGMTKERILFGLLTAFLVSLGGNLHTIYAFTKGYTPADQPVPFWQVLGTQPNLTGYWYPNATRFIPFTIHEFPSYSFVVSDLHGHVLDIPMVLFTIALLLSIVLTKINYPTQTQNSKIKSQNNKSKVKSNTVILNLFQDLISRFRNKFGMTNECTFYLTYLTFIVLGFFLAVMYMTNAWDGLIYFGLSVLVFMYINYYNHSPYTVHRIPQTIIQNTKYLILLLLSFLVFSLPFQLTFKPFVFGIGIDKDHSARWMLLVLWGFFYYCVFGFMIYLITLYRHYSSSASPIGEAARSLKTTISSRCARTITLLFSFFKSIPSTYVFILLLILLSTALLIFPEIFYIRDIYPTHYRANTMFKLGYQAFMMLSLVSGYSIYIFYNFYKNYHGVFFKRLLLNSYFLILILLLFLISIYPIFSVRSYFNSLKDYKGLYGMSYLKTLHSDDYQAILWFNANVKGQPVILEAVGDSYTEYARISANTGLPTVLGWPVHEWLWRGSYDEPGRRTDEVKKFYTSNNLNETRQFLVKYKVKYVIVGQMEKQKYPKLNEKLFSTFGRVVFESGSTKVYLINF